jgi:(E)-4-hydroxy-3-methylbut-2-enyl-diphosphate synthase
VEEALREIEKPCRVAVMGCVVNGPGEAADADFAICAGKGKAYFYRGGRKIATVPEAEIVPRLLGLLVDL